KPCGGRPGVTEVVLGACAEETGERLAVDVDLLVAFAPPVRVGWVIDVEQRPDLVSAPVDAGDVPVAEGPGGDVLARPPSGVEQQPVLPEGRRRHIDRARDVDRPRVAA